MSDDDRSEVLSPEEAVRVSRLATEKDALAFASNARRLGREALAVRAEEHAGALRARAEGFHSPAEQQIARALYAYEAAQGESKGRRFRANRTRKMIKDHGAIRAAERMVLNRKPSMGFEVLRDTGRPELSFEAIIDRFPEEFQPEAVRASRARLAGEPPPPSAPVEGQPASVGRVGLDAEARRFLSAFLSDRNPDRAGWHARYRRTIAAVRHALASGSPNLVFERIWKEMGNGVMNVRQGVLPGDVVERLREPLGALTVEISEDGSPAHFDRVIDQFDAWREAGELPFLPRALIARAFATVRPDRYHTAVKEADQDRLLPWFTEHAGFVVPTGGWASRAAALVAHLSGWAEFGEDAALRNTFPWFVLEQLRDAKGHLPFRPGHHPRQRGVEIVREASVAHASDRHIAIQDALYAQLRDAHGHDFVATEHATGTGGWADGLVKHPDGRYDLYEIKPAATAADAIRQALGQLLEYAYRRGGLENVTLHVVSDAPPDPITDDYLRELDRRFGLKVAYRQIALEPDQEGVA